jgi:hypothetical protein
MLPLFSPFWHEKSTSGEMLFVVFGFTSQNTAHFEKL